MPRYVDHESRRQHVATIAADLVADGGTEALSVRAVADAAGYSTAIVSHYFADKRDLVISAYRAAANRATRRLEAAASGDGAVLRACLEALLPLDEKRRRDWKIFVAFWGMAATYPELARQQRDHARSATSRIERFLERECGAAAQRGDLDASSAATRLMTFVLGVATQAVFDPRQWTARRQREALDAELRLLRWPAARSA